MNSNLYKLPENVTIFKILLRQENGDLVLMNEDQTVGLIVDARNLLYLIDYKTGDIEFQVPEKGSIANEIYAGPKEI